MTDTLYNSEILRLATSIPYQQRLYPAHGSSERRSPICGSRIIVDVDLADDRTIARIGQEVRACALGQASAALMGQSAVGMSLTQVETARDALAAYLAGTRDDPGDWPGLSIFAPARPHPARHASIRLPLEALAEAIQRAGQAEAA